jgi:PAS domain S-box-containing protein
VDERFHRLFEAHPEALLMRSTDGVIGEANAAAGDLFRCDVAELIGRRVDHLTRDLDMVALDDRLAELAAGESITVTATGRRADGRPFPLELVVTADPDGGGDVFIVARDLGERRRLEAGLFALAELARIDVGEESLSELAARAMNLARRLLDADRAAVCAIYDPDQKVEWLASHRMETLIAAAADLRPDQVPWLTRALDSGRPEVIDRRLPSHERTPLSEAADLLGVASFAIVPLPVSAQATGALGLIWSDDPPDLAGNVELLATVGRLVGLALANARLRNALVARQRALDESEVRYRALFEEAPEAMLIQSWDGQVLDANQAAATLFGRRRSWLVGRGTEQLWRASRETRAALLAQLRRRRRGSAQVRGLRADGTSFTQALAVRVISVRGEERLLVHARKVAGGDASTEAPA